MSNKIIKRQNKTLIKKDDKVIKARKGNVKMLHYPAKNGCCETTILFSNKFKVQFADSNISDYEMDCDVCETGGPYSVMIDLAEHQNDNYIPLREMFERG